jgi:uncharacterized membrane protein (DUF4010 family)
MELSWLEGTDLKRLGAFATSLAIGLLIGLERERHAEAKAGLRTCALVALFGAIAAFLSEQLGTPWLLIAGLVLVGAMIIGAYAREEHLPEPGTTTVAAVLVCYVLAAMVTYGYVRSAVMLAIVTVSLLYFKAELRGITQSLTRRDLNSMLQFAVLTFIVLPILPDREYGPYGVLNPYRLWTIVVLIAGVSLAGYVALRLVGQRHGGRLLGIFGGLVSSTATTLVYARHARSHPGILRLAAVVIVLANIVVLIRLAVVAAAVAPPVFSQLLPILGAGFVLGAATLLAWRWRGADGWDSPVPDIKNPTELRTALTFALIYAVMLVVSAWINDVAGTSGLYAVALVSGLTDVDAITVSVLRLFNLGQLEAADAATAIVLAALANIGFKLGMVLVAGGAALFRRCSAAMAAVAAGLLVALLLS